MTPDSSENRALVETIRRICAKSGVAPEVAGEICHEVRHSDIAEALQQSQAEVIRLGRELDELKRKAVDAVPTSWLDPLLTGPRAVLSGSGGTWGCPDIEALLKAVRAEVDAAISGHALQNKD